MCLAVWPYFRFETFKLLYIDLHQLTFVRSGNHALVVSHLTCYSDEIACQDESVKYLSLTQPPSTLPNLLDTTDFAVPVV